MNYYNENDKQKAAWLRALINANVISKGVVDERPIQEVQPWDLEGYEQCHFFAGIGVWSYSLRLAKWPDDKPVWTGSCPCQPFSVAGRRRGTGDKRHLWPEWFRLIDAWRPEQVFGEQVSSPDGLKWFDTVQTDLEGSGYAAGALDLCAAGIGAPHIRQRLYFGATLANAQCGSAERYRHEMAGTPGRMQSSARQQWIWSDFGYGGNASRVDQPRGERFKGQRPQLFKREYGFRGPEVGRGGEVDRLADSESANRRPEYQIDGQTHRRDGYRRGSSISELGNLRSSGSQEQFGGRIEPPRSSTPSKHEFMEYPQSERREQRGQRGPESGERCPNPGCSDVRLGDPSRTGLEERGSESGDTGTQFATLERTGAVNGWWRGAHWVLARPKRVGDPPSVRPVEPGSFPLVNGAPARILRLRGYGDAIIAPLAAEFIRTWEEVMTIEQLNY